MEININKTCSCGKLIQTAAIDSIAGDSFRMPGIYYRCPHCATGRYIHKDNAPAALEISPKVYDEIDKDEDEAALLAKAQWEAEHNAEIEATDNRLLYDDRL